MNEKYISFPDGGMIASNVGQDKPGGLSMKEEYAKDVIREEYAKDTGRVVMEFDDGRVQAANICTEAAEAIGPGKDREQSHGKMGDSFRVAAELWSAYLQHPISPEDVAACMAMLKYSRVRTGDPKRRDHYIDIAGYAGLQGALANANG